VWLESHRPVADVVSLDDNDDEVPSLKED